MQKLFRLNLTTIEICLIAFFGLMVGAVVLPRIINFDNDANEANLRTNMHFAQVAVESYAADHGNSYPAEIDDAVKSYFPGGPADGVTPASQGPLNPFNNAHSFPVLGKFTVNVQGLRSQQPISTGAAAGEILYFPPTNNSSYAILGTTCGGKALQGVNDKTTLVLSNLW